MSKKTTGTEVSVNVDDIVAKELAELSGRVQAPSSNKISTKGKQFRTPDGNSGDELDVIIVDYCNVNAHYPGVYNPNEPKDPDCFAVGKATPESGLLGPHESIAEPHAKNCKDCPKNQWGSAANGGKGKACKNQVRLTVMQVDPDDKELYTLFLSPATLKNWSGYLNKLKNQHGQIVQQVVTHLSFDPVESYPKIVFEAVDQNTRVAETLQVRQANAEFIERPLELRSAGG